MVDSSEEMRDREEQSFNQISEANRMAASAVFHEVRNLSGAISVMLANLKERHSGSRGMEDSPVLCNRLRRGLRKLRRSNWQSRVGNRLDAVDLQSVLDDLRIVIEPDWREIGGAVQQEDTACDA